MYDTIVGGGASGPSAALILGRCPRRVLVCDRDTRAMAPHTVSTASTNNLEGTYIPGRYVTGDAAEEVQLAREGKKSTEEQAG
jgi:thioredoxin reductase